MSALVARHSLDVEAPAAVLWRVLTDNHFIPQYMFGCMAETDWQPGSPLLWKGIADGKVYVKGHVVAVDAPHSLAYTVIDPNNPAIADVSENYLTVTYTLKERGAGASTLEIAQGDYATVAEGQKRYEDSANSGGMILTAIRQLAEAAAQSV